MRIALGRFTGHVDTWLIDTGAPLHALHFGAQAIIHTSPDGAPWELGRAEHADPVIAECLAILASIRAFKRYERRGR
jgi:hypothetical protein